MQKAVDFLREASKRLDYVVVENLDFERLIKIYDKPDALFYLDPPYYDAEKYYPDRFNPDDHERLRDALDRMKGKLILSYNDCPTIRELYKGYNIIGIERFDNLTSKDGGQQYKEVLIKNFV